MLTSKSRAFIQQMDNRVIKMQAILDKNIRDTGLLEVAVKVLVQALKNEQAELTSSSTRCAEKVFSEERLSLFKFKIRYLQSSLLEAKAVYHQLQLLSTIYEEFVSGSFAPFVNNEQPNLVREGVDVCQQIADLQKTLQRCRNLPPQLKNGMAQLNHMKRTLTLLTNRELQHTRSENPVKSSVDNMTTNACSVLHELSQRIEILIATEMEPLLREVNMASLDENSKTPALLEDLLAGLHDAIRFVVDPRVIFIFLDTHFICYLLNQNLKTFNAGQCNYLKKFIYQLALTYNQGTQQGLFVAQYDMRELQRRVDLSSSVNTISPAELGKQMLLLQENVEKCLNGYQDHFSTACLADDACVLDKYLFLLRDKIISADESLNYLETICKAPRSSQSAGMLQEYLCLNHYREKYEFLKSKREELIGCKQTLLAAASETKAESTSETAPNLRSSVIQ